MIPLAKRPRLQRDERYACLLYFMCENVDVMFVADDP